MEEDYDFSVEEVEYLTINNNYFTLDGISTTLRLVDNSQCFIYYTLIR